jgi:RHS repeat-associated protein
VVGTAGYGWLGAKQRSTTTETAGLTLMGDRLYNSATGRFTSVDPEPGGSPNAYAYPTDPINQYDLNGHWWGWRKVFKVAAIVGGVAGAVACGAP